MTSFEAYCLYTALRLHFTTDYDFFRYKGKVKATPEKLKHNRARLQFMKLARKYPDSADLMGLFVANFVAGRLEEWPGYFLTDEATQTLEIWKHNVANLTDIVYRESLALRTASNLREVLEPTEGGHPVLLALFYGDAISLETLIVYDRLFSFRPKWNAGIADDVLWPETEKAMIRYGPFLHFNDEQARHAVKTALKKE